MKLNDALNEYKIYLMYNENKSKRTVSGYIKDIEAYLNWIKDNQIEEVEQIDFKLINSYISLKRETMQASSIARICSSIRSFHRFYSFKFDIINPADNLESPKKVKKLPVYCTEHNHELF